MIVATIVLNWNRRDDTLACLKSLAAQTLPPGAAQRVLVVDNGSTDGSVAAIRSVFPGVDVLELPRNVGYAAGVNAGVRRALAGDADWTLLVNNDTVAAPGLVACLLAATGDPRVGLVAPTVYYHDDPDSVWPSAGWRRRWTLAAFDTTAHPPTDAPYDVDWATGCCLLVRREVWPSVGPFDERFGVYYEDHDFCLRAKAAGWRILHVPEARISHRVARSTGTGSPRQMYLMARSSVAYYLKHTRGAAWRAFIAAYRLGSLVRTVAALVSAGRAVSARAYLDGLRDGLADARRTARSHNEGNAAVTTAAKTETSLMPAPPAHSGPEVAPQEPGLPDTAASGPPGKAGASATTTAVRPGAPLARADILAYLREVRIVEDPIDGRALLDATKEIEAYVWLHARSAELSLRMLARHLPAGRRLRVLELGGAPYFFSALMCRAFDVDLTAANVQAAAWPGEAGTVEGGDVVLTVPGGDLTIDVRVFNIEKDPFPFDDAAFDVVLCMEVLEHLAYSPSHMLAESHRVLRPGGLFFLTVPNFINIKRTVNMLLNRPTEYPYSGYGVYGRHAREFAPFEVARLFEACHYHVAELQTANVWPTFRDHWFKGIGNAVLNAVSSLPVGWLAAKREYILCAAHPHGQAVAAYPEWLYAHRHLYPQPPHGVPKVLEG